MATKKIQTVNVKTNEENPEPVEIIAQHIIQVSEAFGRIQQSRLSERAILLLIRDSIPGSGPSLNDIRLILRHAAMLKDVYVKKVKVNP